MEDVGRFNELDNWTANHGRVAVSGENSYDGTQSIRLSCKPSDKRAMGSYNPSVPIDLSESYPSLAFRYGEEYSGGKFTVWIEAPDADNRLVYERVASPGNGWIETPLLVPDAVVGDPDLSNVTELTFFEYTGPGDSVSIWLDAMTLQERPERSAVVFTFDDGHRSVTEKARPILSEFGFTGSVAAIPGRESYEAHLSVDQLRDLQNEGWDVMSHPQRSKPLPDYSAEKQETLIKESKAWLQNKGFTRGSHYFVYPYSGWDETTKDLVSRYHQAAFAGHGVTTWNPPMSPLISRVKGDDPDDVKSYINRVAEYGGVLPLMYHVVESNSKWISPTGFREIVTTVDQSDLEVLTVSEWFDMASTPLD